MFLEAHSDLDDGTPTIARTTELHPSIGPEHAWLHEIGRAEYAWVEDDEALDAFTFLSRAEGIIPALESAHAVAWLLREGPALPGEPLVVVSLSGRGDKDLQHAAAEIARREGG